MNWVLCLSTILTAVMFDSLPAQAQFSGHGGPVRAIAISADGKNVLSGSFDTAAIAGRLPPNRPSRCFASTPTRSTRLLS